MLQNLDIVFQCMLCNSVEYINSSYWWVKMFDIIQSKIKYLFQTLTNHSQVSNWKQRVIDFEAIKHLFVWKELLFYFEYYIATSKNLFKWLKIIFYNIYLKFIFHCTQSFFVSFNRSGKGSGSKLKQRQSREKMDWYLSTPFY